VVIWLMIATLVVNGVDLAGSALFLFGAVELAQPPGPVQWIVLLTSLSKLALLLSSVPVAIFLWRACENAHVFRPNLKTSPLGAIIWYVVPVASLWKPLEAMETIWNASDPGGSARDRRLLPTWWTIFLVANVIGAGCSWASRGDREHPWAFILVQDVCSMAVAAVFMTVVRRLTANQLLKYEAHAFGEPAAANPGGLERYLR
jgi:hypothetical protein